MTEMNGDGGLTREENHEVECSRGARRGKVVTELLGRSISIPGKDEGLPQ